jgi:hypothetical protein
MGLADTSDRMKLTVQLPSQLLERARDTVFWTPGLTLTALAGIGLREAISTIERKHGRPLPHRTQRLRVGRPISRLANTRGR